MTVMSRPIARRGRHTTAQSGAQPGAVPGAHLITANAPELRRLLRELEPEDLEALDPDLGVWMRRPLGREALAVAVLPALGSAFLAMLNLEIGGLLVLERGEIAAHIRALTVAPDLRKRGLARSMLMQIEPYALEREVRWLWMSIAADNAAATHCALRNGFRRFRPQYMLRERGGMLNVRNTQLRLERLDEGRAFDEVARWIEFEAEVGDAWCAELVQADLLKWLAPPDGTYYLILNGDRDIGLAHAHHGAHASVARITLWLEQALWGGQQEREALKATLDMLVDVPQRLELAFGSGDHLRTSAESFKVLGFVPALFDRVLFVKPLRVDGLAGDIGMAGRLPGSDDA